jgi:hypothetical protein
MKARDPDRKDWWRGPRVLNGKGRVVVDWIGMTQIGERMGRGVLGTTQIVRRAGDGLRRHEPEKEQEG